MVRQQKNNDSGLVPSGEQECSDSELDSSYDLAELLISSIVKEDNKSSLHLIRSTDDPHGLALALASALAAVVGSHSNQADPLGSDFWGDDARRWAEEVQTETERARELLARILADGKPHRYALVKAAAASRGIRTKTLSNAATQLGVMSEAQNRPEHTYRLPKQIGRPGR